MSCNNCNQPTAAITGYNPAYCGNTPPCTSNCAADASQVTYSGPPLSCSGVATGANLQTVLQTFDPLLCAASGDYSTYDTYCLAPITTQKQFVESISNYVCTTQASLTTFTGTTFPAYQASVTAAINAILYPNITCSATGTADTESIIQVLTDYCAAFGYINDNLNISGANWSSCYTVSPTPSTLTEAFNTLIAQICLLKAQVAANTVPLPVFNNTNSCLSGGGTADSLVTTINLIKTQLCQTGTINTTAINWGCITAPSGAQNLQGSIQNIANQLTYITQNTPLQWSNDFTVAPVDNGNLCLGQKISLATPSSQDRYVAATMTDLSPGTLQQKVTAGTNISLDFTSVPGQMIINSSGGGGGGYEVLSDSADNTPGYLYNKLENGASVNGITIVPQLDVSNVNHKVNFIAQIDPVGLFTYLLQAIPTNSTLQSIFCQMVAACPSPCAAPTNVSVTYFPGGTTTTSTSTTSTTTASPGTSTTTSTSTSTSTTSSTSTSTTTSTSSTSTSTSTTTSTSTSSTSSTTTTTTTAAPVSIYTGAQSSSTPPTSGAVTGGTITSQSPSGIVLGDFRPFNATPQYCWCAIPAAYPKTKWYDTSLNNGTIGGVSDLFTIAETVTISAVLYDVYMTQYATQFTDAATQFQP